LGVIDLVTRDRSAPTHGEVAVSTAAIRARASSTRAACRFAVHVSREFTEDSVVQNGRTVLLSGQVTF